MTFIRSADTASAAIMSSRMHRGAAVLALAGSLFAYSAAQAQSTASQTVEQVVVTAKTSVATDGLATLSKAAKDQAIVTQAYIEHQVGSSNFAQLINLLPGVNYSTEDPTGVLSSDFRMHGFDGAHVSFTLDGTPLNDTGNYAIYPGEYSPGETTGSITVNMGQTEVDSPTASAIGGTVNILTKLPSETPQTLVNLTAGSYGYGRAYGEFDTGEIGPFKTRSFLAVNYVDADKTKGEGTITRWGLDGRVYQPLKGDDFLSVGFTYASDRPYFYQSSSPAQYAQFGRSIDYNTQWAAPTAIAGKADGIAGATAAPGFEQGNDSNFWKLHPNPVDFGDIRGQSRFSVGKGLTLTVDPYFFYTLANGGGTTNLSESDPRLAGSKTFSTCAGGGKGVDLNGDGDCLDTVLVYSPSNTQTHRYGVNSSLIYDFNENNRVQLSYSFDYGRHRQTGEYTTIDQATGTPNNVFGGGNGNGTPILALDGTPLRKRDRFSIAELNQISANYVGKFFDDKLHVSIGVRDPFFERQLNQFCYTYNGSSAICDSAPQSAVAAALALDNAKVGAVAGSKATNLSTLLGTTVSYGPNGQANFRLPFSQTYNFNKPLPSLNASYQFDDHSSVYATLSKGFSAPKTDNLYTSSQEFVAPESSDQYGVGYRYHAPTLTFTANLWDSKWNNHIVTSYDPLDPTLSVDRNVGGVDIYGLDAELGWSATHELKFYLSGNLTKSKLDANYQVTVASGPDAGKSIALPVKGKELVLTPEQTFSARSEYKLGDLTLGLQGKYTGKRYVSDMNDVSLPGYFVWDFDAEYKFSPLGHPSSLNLQVYNLLGENYYVRPSTVSNVNAITFANGDKINGSTSYYYTGAPTTVYLTLKTKF